MQAAFVIVDEALLNYVRIPDMKVCEGDDFFPIGHAPHLIYGTEAVDIHDGAGFLRGEGLGGGIVTGIAAVAWLGGRRRNPAQPVSLGVEPGWEEKKCGMLELEAATTFVDAAFAENEALHALSQGVADESPFFKADGVTGEGGRKFSHNRLLLWERELRKNAAI